MAITFDEACKTFRENEFLAVKHFVVVHHLRKDFKDYDVSNSRFYIKQVGDSFLHVAVVEYLNPVGQKVTQVRYSCAADDLLYGLQIKFNSGGNADNEVDIGDCIYLPKRFASLYGTDRFIRRRFRHGRQQAKIRAFLVYLKDEWGFFKK